MADALQTVPGPVVAAFFSAVPPTRIPDLSGFGVRIGDRVELDMAAAGPVLGPVTVHQLQTYVGECRALWELGPQFRGGTIDLVRRVVQARESENPQMVDRFAAVRDAVASVEVLNRWVMDCCGPNPDWEAIGSAGWPNQVRVDRDGLVTTVGLRAAGPMGWPEQLGGVIGPAELSRTVTITVNHAKWRDRRARRLVGVEVSVTERWPTPPPSPLSAGVV